MNPKSAYLMENFEEAPRLEVKTDPETVRKQAQWCGVRPGMRVLDAGCGPGKTTSILYEMIQSGGEIVGLDYSEERILHARQNYGGRPGMDYRVHDLRDPMKGVGLFDLIWVRFVLEYNRDEGAQLVSNLTACLKPGAFLCLIDLDYNCLSHYELPSNMEQMFFKIMALLEHRHNFDPYAGRKLYSYLYDLNFEEINLELQAHHLIYGKIKDGDLFNSIKKMEIASLKTMKAEELFVGYHGGREAFFADFMKFFLDPRRFTYTPAILCKGRKPLSFSPNS
ncbi:MAG: methyltransferase domain-containing protein [Pseudomonadota bacterium]